MILAAYDLVAVARLIEPMTCTCAHGFNEHRVEDAGADPEDGMPLVQAFECRACACSEFTPRESQI